MAISLATSCQYCTHVYSWHLNNANRHCSSCACAGFVYEKRNDAGQQIQAAVEALDARSTQVGGEHYARHRIQPWDIAIEYNLSYIEGSALKYLLRRKGNRLEDLKKARHCLDRLIELEEE